MQPWLVAIFQGIIGGGVGAGVATFVLNFWKAERDFRRAKLEELYTAAHKYTLLMQLVSLRVRTGRFDPSEDQSELTAQVDLMSVLIALYFPQVRPIFESFRSKLQDYMVNKQEGVFRTDNKKFKEDFLVLAQEGENLKKAIADLAREWIQV